MHMQRADRMPPALPPFRAYAPLRIVLSVVLISALLIALFAPAWSTTAPVAAQGNWTEPPLPVASFGEHPRLLISQDYIDNTLKPRMAADADTWQTFAAYVDSGDPEEDAEWSAGTALRALALAWLVTENPTYAGRAKAVMVDLAAQVENNPALTSDAGFDGQFMQDVAALAVGYDWLYDTLTADDRAGVRLTLWRAAKLLRDPAADTEGVVWLDGELMAFGNYDPRWLWALTSVGLALWGENEDVPALLEYCREVLTDTVIPALDIQTGGAWAEGPVYGFIAIWFKVQTALAWWTAAGENYFDDTSWWYDRLGYDVFLYYPSEAYTFNEDWGDPIHNYPSIIGDSERYHAMAAYGRAQDGLLRAVFPNTEYGNWMSWFLRQPPDTMPGWMSAEDFLWRDPDFPGLQPFSTTWVAPYLGHVFMRSNWTDAEGTLDASATYVSFNAGDHLTYHQFFDQGNFTIFHNGADLLVRSGVYSGDGTSDHDANWYVRSIAANTILVCDLAENFDDIRPNNEREVWVNDCGQRTLSPAPRTAINVDFLLENWQAYDTGTITRVGNADLATYIRADLTGAYNSTAYTTPENDAKVSAVMRELVYWRPGTVIAFDRVQTTYPTYTPQVVFHFQTEPTLDDLFLTSTVDNSTLYMQNMLPESYVTVLSGYEVGGLEVDQSWGEPVGNNFESEPYGVYRVEIAPERPNLDHWFMTVFVAQDADQPAPEPGALVLGDTMRGVAIGTIQVMFDMQPEDEADITQAVFQIAPAAETVLLTGLTPGVDYHVMGEGNLNYTYTADDAGLITLTNVLPGATQLTMVEE